ncbi:MAG: hypothetical protein LBJ76_05185 [Candidatus Accumulibacter sp.]|jgi:hypothetical protein|nr:hypothetical protein [Accumulibacter sp.]
MVAETLLFSLPAGDDFLRGSFKSVEGSIGIVVLSRASAGVGEAENVCIEAFNGAGLSTFDIGLLTAREESFSDIRDNVPLLAGRLLDFIEHLKRRRAHPTRRRMAIYAEDAASPAALRAAAERDNDIVALACRGGLIDRAGSLYLGALNSRLLFIAERGDAAFLSSARRAFDRIGCVRETALIDGSAPGADDAVARKAVRWFLAAFSSDD